MPRKRENVVTSQWVADFETTTDPEDCRVWAWGIGRVSPDPEVVMGNSIKTFVAFVCTRNSHVYFHNLEFDGKFILDHLLRNGFRHVDDRPRKGEFSTLIDDSGKFYSITVRWNNGMRTEFRDSYKKLPMPVAKVAKAFDLAIEKGEIDYHAPRPIGHALTDDEKKYLKNDVSIVAQALDIQFNQGMGKLTVGADSLASYMKMIGGRPTFRRIFPVLPVETDNHIRSAYRGGFTYVAKRFQCVEVGPGRVYDVNSLYPSVMRQCVLPYGDPIPFDAAPDDSLNMLYVCQITFTAKLKKDHIPCIQIKNSPHYVNTEYQEIISEPITKWCTSVDLKLWQDHYDLEILTYDGGYYFHATQGLFDEYVDYWADIKAKATDEGLRSIAKLMLNSLYGKFASNPDKTGKVPYFDPDKNIVRYRIGPEETADPVYTPMGVFITAYARDITIRAAQAHYDRFVYADTDSLHMIGDYDPEDLDIHKSRLGAWKREMRFDRALFVRAKCYTEHGIPEGKTEAVWSTHVAGLPRAVAEKVTIDDFVDGKVFTGKLSPTTVPGGVVLRDVGFKLNMTT